MNAAVVAPVLGSGAKEAGWTFWDVRRADAVVVIDRTESAPTARWSWSSPSPKLVAVRIQGALGH